MKINNKKGLSDVVTTVLIILLVIVAVATIASFIIPSLRDTGKQVEGSQACLSLSIEPVSCDTSDSKVVVTRTRGESIKVTNLTFSSDDGTVKTLTDVTKIPKIYESTEVTTGLTSPASVKVAAQIEVDGQLTYCGQSVAVTCNP